MSYQPGKNKPLASGHVDPNLTFPGRRTLSADEYSDYYADLDRTDLSAPVKAGIAFILQDDLKKVYGQYWERYKDPKVTKFLNIFKSYEIGTQEKKIADGEALAFDNYRKGKNPYLVDDDSYLQAFLKQKLDRIEFAREIARKQQEIIDNRELIIQQEEAKMKEIAEKAMAKTGDDEYTIVTEAMNEFMKLNIMKYMGDVFNANPLSTNIDDQQSVQEYEARAQIAKRVTNGEINPTAGINLYKEMLKVIFKKPNQALFEFRLKEILKRNFHPIYDLLTQPGADATKVTTRKNIYAHPMAKGVS